jgi:hypothetical protein
MAEGDLDDIAAPHVLVGPPSRVEVPLGTAGLLVLPVDGKGFKAIATRRLALPVAVRPDRADGLDLELLFQVDPDPRIDIAGIKEVAVWQEAAVLERLVNGNGHGQVRYGRRGRRNVDDKASGPIIAGFRQVDLVALPGRLSGDISEGPSNDMKRSEAF